MQGLVQRIVGPSRRRSRFNPNYRATHFKGGVRMRPVGFNRRELDWRIARKSASGNCIEVAKCNDLIAFRHSRRPDGEVILYTKSEFDAFLDGIKKGEFDDLLE